MKNRKFEETYLVSEENELGNMGIARKALSWKPAFKFDDALKYTVEHYEGLQRRMGFTDKFDKLTNYGFGKIC